MEKRADWQRAIERGNFWTEAEAREVLAACEQSGETVVAFARRHGLNVSRLYGWRQRLKRNRAAEGAFAPLIPMTIRAAGVESSPGRGVCIIDGELRVEVADTSAVSAAWVATLLRRVRREGGP